MLIEIKLLSGLQKFYREDGTLFVDTSTLDEAIASIKTTCKPLANELFNESGAIKGFINIYLNEDNIRDFEKGAVIHVQPGDTITILSAIAGG